MSVDADVDFDSDVDEVEETEAPAAEGKASKPAKEKAAPKRAPLPDGFVTPIGLTKAINEQGLYEGSTGELKPQAMYSYIKNAPESHPFPLEEKNGRSCVELEAGLAWWKEKNARAEARRKNAAEKKAGAAEKKAKKAETSEAEGDDEASGELEESE